MPKTLAKIQKKVNKKKGKVNSLHENSRDSQKLRRAGARSEKLARVAAARAKMNQPHLQRVTFFKGAAQAIDEPLKVEKIHSLVQRYLNRDDDELRKLKNERRPGRPSSTREELLKQRIATEEREYDTGFWIPDMENMDNISTLREWDETWASLNTLKYVRLGRNGLIHPSNFPPNGQS